MKIEKKDLPKGLVELKIIVDEKEFEGYHGKAFTVVQQAVEIDGFRKGNAPEDLIVKKYGDMIENLSKYSQLILITHNRETMSRAGVIYGVTMGGGGISKILSIQFEEAVAVAK